MTGAPDRCERKNCSLGGLAHWMPGAVPPTCRESLMRVEFDTTISCAKPPSEQPSRSFGRYCASVALCLILASLATAQPKITLPPAKSGKFDALTPVMAQHPRVIAVSDVHSMLAIGL